MFPLKNLARKELTCLVSNVPADGLTPLGTKTSVSTVMTMFGSCIYMELVLEG